MFKAADLQMLKKTIKEQKTVNDGQVMFSGKIYNY